MVYLDWSSTTPICESAKQAIVEHLDDFGNPSSQHEFGRKSRLLVENARERIAKCINAKPEEIYFTSGGSEANTWALNYRFVLSSPIEHHSIRLDHKIPICSDGIIDSQDVLERICLLRKHEKFLNIVSCAYINNEIGVVQDIKSIAGMAHKCNLLFHTDAVQAVGHIPIDVQELGCDMLSASGHKFGAIKGTGFLFVKNGTKIDSLINGGKQEFGKRPGTENVHGIISMAAALEDAIEHMDERNNHIRYLRDELLNKLLKINGSHINGSLAERTMSNINIRFDGVPGSRLVSLCSMYDVCISSGSACNEGTPRPSHVLKAIGLSDDEALNSVRITLGYKNTIEEINYTADIITKLVERIRSYDK